MLRNRRLVLSVFAALAFAGLLIRVTPLQADQTCYIQPAPGSGSNGLTAFVRVGSHTDGDSITMAAIFYGPGSDSDWQDFAAPNPNQAAVAYFEHTFPQAGTYYFSVECFSSSGEAFADTYVTVG